MFKLDGAPYIKINLNNGIYVFEKESATGKTYLCDTVKKHALLGEPVVGYSYTDKMMGSNLTKLISANTKLLVLDRYDMYIDDYINEIEQLSKTCIVLIDSKEHPSFDDEPCYIELNKKGIEVSQ